MANAYTNTDDNVPPASSLGCKETERDVKVIPMLSILSGDRHDMTLMSDYNIECVTRYHIVLYSVSYCHI
jgi:hypothetical protein